jgi:hypothetical protein
LTFLTFLGCIFERLRFGRLSVASVIFAQMANPVAHANANAGGNRCCYSSILQRLMTAAAAKAAKKCTRSLSLLSHPSKKASTRILFHFSPSFYFYSTNPGKKYFMF